MINRSLGRNGKRNFELIFKKQRQAMIAARKWEQIGVPVLQFNTSEITIEEEMNIVMSKISELCGLDMTNK